MSFHDFSEIEINDDLIHKFWITIKSKDKKIENIQEKLWIQNKNIELSREELWNLGRWKIRDNGIHITNTIGNCYYDEDYYYDQFLWVSSKHILYCEDYVMFHWNTSAGRNYDSKIDTINTWIKNNKWKEIEIFSSSISDVTKKLLSILDLKDSYIMTN